MRVRSKVFLSRLAETPVTLFIQKRSWRTTSRFLSWAGPASPPPKLPKRCCGRCRAENQTKLPNGQPGFHPCSCKNKTKPGTLLLRAQNCGIGLFSRSDDDGDTF